MSAIAFRAADTPLGREASVARIRRITPGMLVDLALFAFCAAMLAVMSELGGGETIPYHLLFVVLTLAYGFRVWPILPTAVVIVTVTTTTGLVMFNHYQRGLIDSAELAEIPLMPALLFAMVWHARRRAVAQQEVQAMADHHAVMLERERNFFRSTSHAIRTPVTIARGHLELTEPEITSVQVAEDVQVALRQLDRMAILSDRLLALAKLDAGQTPPALPVHLRSFVLGVGRDWTAWESRTWKVTCDGDGVVLADPEWLGLAVDALIENALHFTSEQGCITIAGVSTPTRCTISVSDDGPGISPADLEHVFERFWHRRPPNGPMGSGLGLAMARATVRAAGGDLWAHNKATGGAVFELSLPRETHVANRGTPRPPTAGPKGLPTH